MKKHCTSLNDAQKETLLIWLFMHTATKTFGDMSAEKRVTYIKGLGTRCDASKIAAIIEAVPSHSQDVRADWTAARKAAIIGGVNPWSESGDHPTYAELKSLFFPQETQISQEAAS